MGTGVNLVSVDAVSKSYGARPVLDDVSLGIGAGQRIGVVGVNGGGKTTLLRLVARTESPDTGRVTHTRGLQLGALGQHTEPTAGSVRDAVLPGADHEWAADSRVRAVLDGLGLHRMGLDSDLVTLSGGERRRVALAARLVTPSDLLLLDEPTNHLDVQAVDWLAGYLAARRGALLVVTHDRWFLDAVCQATWEVADGAVHQYDGGYAAYILARVQRARLESAAAERREPAAQGTRVAAPWSAGADQQISFPRRRCAGADRRRTAGQGHGRAAVVLDGPAG